MTTGNIETDKKTTPADKKPASPDTLVEGGKSELSEDELKDVAGGPIYVRGGIKGELE